MLCIYSLLYSSPLFLLCPAVHQQVVPIWAWSWGRGGGSSLGFCKAPQSTVGCNRCYITNNDFNWNNFKRNLKRSFKLWTTFLCIKASFGSTIEVISSNSGYNQTFIFFLNICPQCLKHSKYHKKRKRWNIYLKNWVIFFGQRAVHFLFCVSWQSLCCRQLQAMC